MGKDNEPTRKYVEKIPEIIELRQQEKTWSAIGRELDIPRKSLYNLRHSEGFMRIANDMWLDLMDDIAKQRKEATAYSLDQSIKNQIRIFTLISGANLDNLQGSKHLEPSPETCEECILTKRRDVTQLIQDILELIPKEKHNAFNRLMEKQVESDTPYTRAADRLRGPKE